MKKCATCGKDFAPRTSEKTCPGCPPPHKTCPRCGSKKGHGSKVCVECDNKTKSERAKSIGCGKWMLGRTLSTKVIQKIAKGSTRANRLLRQTGQTQVQNLMRKGSNRQFFCANPRSSDPDAREKHNSDWRYKEWRTAVYLRDDYTCLICGKRGGNLNAHHIMPWAKYPKLRYVVDNGMTVCEGKCHSIAAKMERKEAFEIAGIPDPTRYEE